MSLPKVVYNPGSGDVTLQFVRGPQGFHCDSKAIVHDNTATSGIRERVHERTELVLSFGMGHLKINDDLASWSTFMVWALAGGAFKFYPDASQSAYYNCVSQDEEFAPARVGPGVYSATFTWQIVPDTQSASATTGLIMRQFYGYTS